MANFTTSFPAATSNNILEMLAAPADGRTVTVPSGTYTFQNVTAGQTMTTTHTDIAGSAIAYKPPTGTKFVKYKFTFKMEATERGGISGFRLLFDGTTVTHAGRGSATNYSSSNHHLGEWMQTVEFVFDLTVSTTNKAEGQIAPSDWTTAKTIKVTGREYSASYEAEVHGNHYEDGTSASGAEIYTKPLLMITAYS